MITDFADVLTAVLAGREEFNAKALEAFNATGLPRVFNAGPGSNGVEITMYDVIGSEATNAATFAQALTDAAGAPVTIRLSSPGGSVFAGWTMYNSLKNYAGETTVIVDGVCASIASIIALGADKTLTAETSLWMAHNSWAGVIGNAADLRDSATTLEKIDGNLANVYAAKTGQDASVWAERMAAETWFTSSEAVAVGLCDGIAEPAPKAKPEAEAVIEPMAEIVNSDVAGIQARRLHARRVMAAAIS